MTLTFEPIAPLSWSYRIQQDGAPIAVLDLNRIKTGGRFELDGHHYVIERERFLGPVVLREEGRILARAQRTALLLAAYRIVIDDRQLTVQTHGLLNRAADITHGDLRVATLHRKRLFHRAVTVEVAQNVPLHFLIFITALIILHWRRRARAARS